jgi:hypothetical protein
MIPLLPPFNIRYVESKYLQRIPAAEADFLKLRAVNVPAVVASQSLKEGGT